MKNEPNIRIKGFEGEWKKCLFGSIMDCFSGGTPQANEQTYYGGGIPFIRSGEINDNNTSLFLSEKGLIYSSAKMIEKGTLLYALYGATSGEVSISRIKGAINQAILAIYPYKEYDKYFIKCWLEKNKAYIISTYLQGGQGNLSGNIVKSFILKMPQEIHEQRAIATYFRNIDSLIETADRKLASLKQVKEASLQSMFPKEGQKVPEVRFKGFEGEWKTVQLCECLEVSKERNSDNKYGIEDVLSVSDDSGVTNQIELLGRSFAGKSVSNYGILHEGEIVYTKSPLKSKPFGIIKRNNYKTGIVSVLYAIYKPHIDISSAYIHYYFSPSWRLNNYIHPLVNKGAKNTMNISDEAALMGYIPLPPTLSEQRKIASFFVHLDKQIAIAQQRLDLLRRIKSACLDEMFV